MSLSVRNIRMNQHALNDLAAGHECPAYSSERSRFVIAAPSPHVTLSEGVRRPSRKVSGGNAGRSNLLRDEVGWSDLPTLRGSFDSLADSFAQDDMFWEDARSG